MIDAAAILPTEPVQWGPIIAVLLAAGLAGIGWAIRSVFTKLENLSERMVAVETKQNLSFENTVQVARKVGVTEKQINKANT